MSHLTPEDSDLTVTASNEVSLVSLAMLIVNAQEKNQDYLDYLKPFLFEVIAGYECREFNRGVARDDLAKQTV
jgi:hypothetical protein